MHVIAGLCIACAVIYCMRNSTAEKEVGKTGGLLSPLNPCQKSKPAPQNQNRQVIYTPLPKHPPKPPTLRAARIFPCAIAPGKTTSFAAIPRSMPLPLRRGKVVSAGTNGEIVQWQAFFFDPTTSVVSPTRRASGAPVAPESGGTPAPATPLINNSLVGLINERRNRNEEKIQRSLRSRNPSEPTLRRVGHQAPRGDGRMGGVDVFEMDYRVCGIPVFLWPPTAVADEGPRCVGQYDRACCVFFCGSLSLSLSIGTLKAFCIFAVSPVFFCHRQKKSLLPSCVLPLWRSKEMRWLITCQRRLGSDIEQCYT